MPTSHRAENAVAYSIQVDQLTKTYNLEGRTFAALNNVTYQFPQGKFTAVMGPSGSGKSTLLQCMAGLDHPTSGQVLLGGTDLNALNATELSRVHRERIGFIFQSFNLLPMLTVSENISLPLQLSGRSISRDEINAVLAQVGLEGLGKRRPAELSGGQQQRVAIARALTVRPEVLFADEPTGALDIATGRQVLKLLRSVVDAAGQTVIMVTHDPAAATHADTVVFFADGQIRDVLQRPTVAQISAQLERL